MVAGIGASGFVGGAVIGAAVMSHPGRPAAAAAPPPCAADGSLGRYAADVLRVIDGDTFEAQVHVWLGHMLTTRVRLRGIDAPELNARCAEERAGAEAARAALRGLLDERAVTVWNIGPDKYFGRVVADAGTRRTPDISAALLEQGVARRYDGGHRDGWCGMRVSRR